MTSLCLVYLQTNPTKRDRLQHLSFLRRIRKEHKTQITIFAIIGAFVLCFTPFCCVNFTAAVFEYEIPQSVDVLCTLLVAMASAVNPILYGWLDMAFRSAFKRILAPIFSTPASKEVTGVRHVNQLKAWSMPNIKAIRNVARGGGNDDGAAGNGIDGHDDGNDNGVDNVGADDGDDGYDAGNDAGNGTEDSYGDDKGGIDDNDGRSRGGVIMVLPMFDDGIHAVSVLSRVNNNEEDNSFQLS